MTAVTFIALAFIGCFSVAVGDHIKGFIYQRMCDNSTTFRGQMITCMKEMPRKDQIIFQICGSALLNDTSEDYNGIIDDMCENATHAIKVAACIDYLFHKLHHFTHDHDQHHHDHHQHHHDESHDHDDESHDHDDDELHDHDDDESHDHDHDEPSNHDDGHDHHVHDHDHEHDHGDNFGHGIYTQECFKKLYDDFNITTSTEADE